MPSIPSQNPHLNDPALQPFLSPNFDPTTYLNSTLPPLTFNTTTTPRKPSQTAALTLTEHVTQTQTLLSKLSAHTSRLSTTLTQQTDDILRSGSRLAYEVELLRGEASNLTDALNEGLKDDIVRFVPSGLDTKESTTIMEPNTEDAITTTADETHTTPPSTEPTLPSQTPPSVTHLRTLLHVRTRLESVLKTFDQALSWPHPPPLDPSSSTFISVSAPNNTSDDEKARSTAQQFRDEVNELFVSDGVGGLEGVEAAEKRVGELRGLCEVWKGTAEERNRVRFVEGLKRMVEERRRAVLEGEGARRREGSPAKGGGRDGRVGSEAGRYGFIDNLQRLRGNIYLD